MKQDDRGLANVNVNVDAARLLALSASRDLSLQYAALLPLKIDRDGRHALRNENAIGVVSAGGVLLGVRSWHGFGPWHLLPTPAPAPNAAYA